MPNGLIEITGVCYVFLINMLNVYVCFETDGITQNNIVKNIDDYCRLDMNSQLNQRDYY